MCHHALEIAMNLDEPRPGTPAYMLMLAHAIEQTLFADPDGDGMSLGPTDLEIASEALRYAARSIALAQQHAAICASLG